MKEFKHTDGVSYMATAHVSGICHRMRHKLKPDFTNATQVNLGFGHGSGELEHACVAVCNAPCETGHLLIQLRISQNR